MFKRAAQIMQSRTRQAADAAPTHGGIQASDAFKKPTEHDALDAEREKLVVRLREIDQVLRAINDHRAFADIRRQVAHMGPSFPQEKSSKALRRRLVDEKQVITNRLTELKPLLRRHRIADAEQQRTTFESVFLRVAKEMLAEPVYLRLLNEAQSRCGQD